MIQNFKSNTIKCFKFSIIDLFRQIIYAFFSAYEMSWFCLGLEIFWILIFAIFRPFENKSDYILQGGSSIIIIISNALSLSFEYNIFKSLSFGCSMEIIVAACLLTIISLYLFFAIDFSIPKNKDKKLEEDIVEETSYIILLSFLIISPFAWLFYGMIIPLIKSHFDNYYSNYHVI